MLVSILVPCYNHEKYVVDCLKSIVNQTYQNIELIIIDDCSSDNSFALIKDYEYELKNRFETVIIERNEFNLGVCKTLNKMVKKSNGDYLKIIASDDMLPKNSITDLFDFAQSSDADIIFGNVLSMSENTKYPYNDDNLLQKAYTIRPKDGFDLTDDLIKENYISAPGVLFPKTTFTKFGLFDENYFLEDLEYWLRVSKYGKFNYCDNIVALYRTSNYSLSRFNNSIDGHRKQEQFFFEKYKIIQKYGNIKNKEQQIFFLNSELNAAIGTLNSSLIYKIMDILLNNDMQVYKSNKFKLFLYKAHIYRILKYMKTRWIK